MRRHITLALLFAAGLLAIAAGTAPAAKADPTCVRLYFPPAPPIIVCTP